MEIHLTRDSVCAADDCDAPHFYKLSVSDNASFNEICFAVILSDYLPRISGGCATWSLASVLPRAVIAQQWPNPKLIIQTNVHKFKELNFSENILNIHINYHAQIDPEVVFKVLKEFNPLPFRNN